MMGKAVSIKVVMTRKLRRDCYRRAYSGGWDFNRRSRRPDRRDRGYHADEPA